MTTLTDAKYDLQKAVAVWTLLSRHPNTTEEEKAQQTKKVSAAQRRVNKIMALMDMQGGDCSFPL